MLLRRGGPGVVRRERALRLPGPRRLLPGGLLRGMAAASAPGAAPGGVAGTTTGATTAAGAGASSASAAASSSVTSEVNAFCTAISRPALFMDIARACDRATMAAPAGLMAISITDAPLPLWEVRTVMTVSAPTPFPRAAMQSTLLHPRRVSPAGVAKNASAFVAGTTLRPWGRQQSPDGQGRIVLRRRARHVHHQHRRLRRCHCRYGHEQSAHQRRHRRPPRTCLTISRSH